jgi:putative membrane protein
MNTILPLLSVSLIVLSAIFVAIGWYHIARRRINTHMKFMIAAAITATLFFIFYVSRTIFIGNTPFAGPDSLFVFYLSFLLFHIVLATTGGVMGLITLRYAYKKNFAKHRKIGPVTSVVWFATAITGVVVYYLLYIKYPPDGTVVPVIEAIFGK